MSHSETQSDCATDRAIDERWALLKPLKTENALLRDLLAIAKCPACDGSGCIVEMVGFTTYVSRDMAMDAGDPSMEGSVYTEPHPEMQRCEWCGRRDELLQPTP